MYIVSIYVFVYVDMSMCIYIYMCVFAFKMYALSWNFYKINKHVGYCPWPLEGENSMKGYGFSFLFPSSFLPLSLLFLSYSSLIPCLSSFFRFPQFFLSCSSLFSVPLVRSSLPFLFLIQICSSIFISTELRRHSDTAPNNKKTIGFFSKAKTRNFDGASFIVRVSICSLFQHQHCLILLIYIYTYIHWFISMYTFE